MNKSRRKRRDDTEYCEVIVRIPKRLIVDYVREPVCFNQPRSDVRRYVDYLFHMALWDKCRDITAGGEEDG